MVSRRVSRSAALGFVVLACPWLLSACAESGTAAPRGKEAAAKSVKTEAVREEAVHRTVEVVGTLAAEDEVTISSQAEGVVSRVLADLGDPVKAGQPLVELDREKLQYNLDQQKAALARALTKYGGTDTAICRRSRRRPTSGRRPPNWPRPSRPTTAPTSCTSGR